MRDVLIAGIYDTEIRRDIFGVEGITEKSLNEVTSLVDKHEMARNAHMVSGSTSAISEREKVSFSSSNSHKSTPLLDCRNPVLPTGITRVPANNAVNSFGYFPRGWNTKPHEACKNCYRMRHQNNQHGQNRSPALASVSSISNQEQDPFQVISQISAVTSEPSEIERLVT